MRTRQVSIGQPIYADNVNSFTLRNTLESIVCYSHSFENNLGIKQKLTKYLKESCCLASDQHFSFKCFQKDALYGKYFQNRQASFGRSECKWVNSFMPIA